MATHATDPVPPSIRLTDVEAGSWTLDAARSSIGIRNKSMWSLATVTGAFTGFSGTGGIAPDGTVSGTLTIEAASIRTKQSRLAADLRSADFFDVGTYPTFRTRQGWSKGSPLSLSPPASPASALHRTPFRPPVGWRDA
ncbi:YceI family protein [Streptomyces beijiangensis]|uniref:YceI family protein n=1 Tax=Streptomyces beijiangensis TaxID=163361 RepID=A0A939F930_9ACTN|nr:YceI family protein [Streptomyces beijiangensis]MBO0513192.1 YceI family protein [Streptomyces beijiangensis]